MAQTNDKTDESVKAGLGMEGDTTLQNDVPETANEQDADEQVHARRKELPNDENEVDGDDVVHQKNVPAANTDLDQQDPDDLVHDTTIRE